MSIARHHAEWLSLLETSGPFLSMPVLLEAFPQGLDAHDAEHHRMLRFGHGEWEDNRHQPATHAAWIRFVLARTLDYSSEVLAAGQAIPQTLQAEVPEHRELLRPDLLLGRGRNSDAPAKARASTRERSPGARSARCAGRSCPEMPARARHPHGV